MRKGYIPWVVFGLFLLGLGLYTYRKYSDSDRNGGWNQREERLAEIQKQLATSSNEIKKYQGESQCTRDDECKVVGLGTPICDLYKNFIIYSKRDAQEAKLLEAIAQFNRQHQEMSKLSLSPGSCGMKPDAIRCVNRRCTPVR